MPELTLMPRASVRGTFTLPGDKSVSHRALLFGALANGPMRARGLAPGGDVRSTRRVLESLGVAIEDAGPGEVVVHGRGWAGLHRAAGSGALDLDCGNSGTSARLFMGLLAGGRGTFRLLGDASLSRRPMRRVAAPLARFGARIEGGDTLPLLVHGLQLTAAEVETGVASAQVKSALVLAALQAEGTSVVREPEPTRDHTERLLAAMGAPLVPLDATRTAWRIEGGAAPLAPLTLDVPRDPSSAAYAVALACLLPSSEVTFEGVLLNPGRLGFYRLLQRMGAAVRWNVDGESPEPVGRLLAGSCALSGIEVGAADVVDAVDEIPLLALVASLAKGPTVIRGASELRVKESDRIAATAALLRAFGAEVDELPDGLAIAGGARFRAAHVDARGDHRIAMCAAVAAALCDAPSAVSGAEWVAISYPGFFDDLQRITR